MSRQSKHDIPGGGGGKQFEQRFGERHVRDQYGTWGRVRAIKHIAPAADAGIQRFELSFRARMNRG